MPEICIAPNSRTFFADYYTRCIEGKEQGSFLIVKKDRGFTTEEKVATCCDRLVRFFSKSSYDFTDHAVEMLQLVNNLDATRTSEHLPALKICQIMLSEKISLATSKPMANPLKLHISQRIARPRNFATRMVSALCTLPNFNFSPVKTLIILKHF